jgi:hypothetical protein
MGLRYRKRIRVPFGRLNLSRSGASVSIGRPGAWLTLGHSRRRATLGWPGSGLSFTTVSSTRSTARARSGAAWWLWALLALAIYVYLSR